MLDKSPVTLQDVTNGLISAEPEIKTKKEHPQRIVWIFVFLLFMDHLFAVWGLTMLFGKTKAYTILWTVFLIFFCGISVTAGAHRLWAHRSYKAKWPLELVLAIGFTTSFQFSIFRWVRDHRTHHKYSETDADPHNANRGFFYSHIGWLMMEKHPENKRAQRLVYMEDIKKNRILMFQHRWFAIWGFVCAFLVPVAVPYYLWDEDILVSTMVPAFFRHVVVVQAAFFVNSAAHLWGSRPYNRFIEPRQNKLVAIFALGEGWHNYHHAFPMDYKTDELGNYGTNFAAAFIDFCAWLGLAYDCKTVSPEIVKSMVRRAGDGTHDSLMIDGEISEKILTERKILKEG